MSANHTGMLIVDGVAIKTPNEMTWGFQRVSLPDAGRTEDGVMHVHQKTTKIKIHLGWTGLSPSEAHAIAVAFEPEYINVRYWDVLQGEFLSTPKLFYTGDWSAAFKVWSTDLKRFGSFSFDIIEV